MRAPPLPCLSLPYLPAFIAKNEVNASCLPSTSMLIGVSICKAEATEGPGHAKGACVHVEFPHFMPSLFHTSHTLPYLLQRGGAQGRVSAVVDHIDGRQHEEVRTLL